jgi:hypothetical protein
MLLFAAIFMVVTMVIYNFLKKRGEKVTFIWLKLMMISYVDHYKKITKEETGRVGILYYIWIISINLALLCFFLYLFIG